MGWFDKFMNNSKHLKQSGINTVEKICSRDEALFAPIISLMNRWLDVEVVYLDDENFCLYDKLAECYNVYAHQPAVRKNILSLFQSKPERVRIFDEKTYDMFIGMWDFRHVEICREVSTRNMFPDIPDKLRIYQAKMTDAERILDYYHDGINPKDIYWCIENGKMFVGESVETSEKSFVMGGMHIDGSVGFLFVDKEHRRQGLGSEMGRFLFNRVLEDSEPIAFCEILTTNEPSIKLHKQLGCNVSDSPVYWVFDKYF